MVLKAAGRLGAYSYVVTANILDPLVIVPFALHYCYNRLSFKPCQILPALQSIYFSLSGYNALKQMFIAQETMYSFIPSKLISSNTENKTKLTLIFRIKNTFSSMFLREGSNIV